MAPSDFTVKGSILEPIDDGRVHYLAAAPPDYRCSYSGSGLPFASPEQAFHATPNVGEVTAPGGTFSIPLLFPNSYQDARKVVPPTLYLMFRSGGRERRISIRVAEGVPYRLLEHPGEEQPRPREGAEFYGVDAQPARSQEQVLRDSEYPRTNRAHADFWGARPPL